MSLAIGSYEKLRGLDDGADLLNLAWTQDEREHLSADVMAVVAEELAAELAEDLPYIGDYMVKDPYGEHLLGPAVAEYFGRPGWDASVTCGAGVGPLLHDLALLAGGTAVEVVTDVYPDFPHWAGRAGGRCVPPGTAPDARLLLLERPALTDGRHTALDAVRELCDTARRRGAVVLVDESNANYLPPAYSAANLTPEVPNLIVVRGLSKAYGLGGVRLGYCVASPAQTAAVRGAVTPLGASSLSLRIARRILALGDITAGLRERIARNRPYVRGLLAGAGLPEPVEAADGLPYVLFPDRPRQAVERLAAHGVQAKAHPVWSSSGGGLTTVGRLSVPLRESRLTDLVQRLARTPSPAPDQAPPGPAGV
ncbi:aminotransferase class I/II-fold pyridoxal phosphate-dependent enzyme [Streptomyces sp. XM83C]|uniref:Aminotransferase class I/II-fold pyridoxal phosphate-dependent enzyme n=1 Tax=Streptomyces thermocoprophilus TaxID=78356 RepID=A0ABV5VDA8_9ACTN|nr:aminotransferase class I/II-fold pyridoxal phosphate-dependent enzyme [Streptomyces sp. XM83C]MCK1819763.1 aminotransferase class I/II-fold pyridoxal phosphate-dependent enzyme [Streptomyces sp. XM83C]